MKPQNYRKLLLALGSVLVTNALISTPVHAIELSSTVEDAILNSPEFRQQVKLTQGVDADLSNAEGSWLPKVDLAAGIGKEITDNQSGTADLTRQEASVRVTQNLFEGFGTVNEIKRQEARLTAERLNIEATANQVALDMTTAYINLLKEQQLLNLSKESVVTHQRILDQINQRTQGGVGTTVELNQAQARLALANANLAASKNNYQDALSRFHRVLGRFPDSDLVAPGKDFILPNTLEEATNFALLNHPSLRAANSDIMETRAQHAVAQKAFYPQVDFELQKTYDRNINGVEGGDENFQAMFRMRYNLYNGGKDSATTDRTASQIYQAAEVRNQTRRETIENLRYAWEAKNYILEQLRFQQSQIQLTKSTLEGYREQFRIGQRSLLDLLNTENEYLTARTSLIKSDADLKIAQYRILNGMGALVGALNIDINYEQLAQNVR